MSTLKRVTHLYLFPNANLGSFDKAGNQLGQLQGAFSIDKLKRNLLERTDDCIITGMEILPNGWYKECLKYADYFRHQNLNYHEIQEL